MSDIVSSVISANDVKRFECIEWLKSDEKDDETHIKLHGQQRRQARNHNTTLRQIMIIMYST